MTYFCVMILNSLSILNYKNIAEASLSFSDKVNCFLGNNGMGKTNLLDAIYYLSNCKSALSASDSTTIRFGEDAMLLQGNYTRLGKKEVVACAIQAGRKKMKRNGKEYKRLSEHIGLLPLVLVSPQDWDMIVGGSESRRRLIDRIISQGNHEYLDALIRYNRALEQRNSMLKQGYSDPLLYESVDAYIVDAANEIYEGRRRWIDQFTPVFMQFYNAIGGNNETVSLDYRSELNDAPAEKILAANFERDRALGFTSGGVHRDDIELMLGNALMRKTGSQGQCKTYTIALRLAQFDFLRSQSSVTPLLLLDDIFDKLDSERVANIMRIVSSPTFGQIFISDTNRQHIDETIAAIGSDYRIFSVASGSVEESSCSAGSSDDGSGLK